MKRNLFTIALVAAGLMMSACNKSQKNDGTSVESENTETAAQSEEDDLAEDDVTNNPLAGIVAIGKEWAGKTIKVETNGSAPSIEQFAQAFCQTYPQCETNKELSNYLSNPAEYKSDLYGFDVDSRNGYICCMMKVETTHETDLCYWNRKNGHKLIATYMEAGLESGASERLVVFYDYDSYTGIMTPEPSLTSLIEERTKTFDTYSVVLPKEGKNITVYAYTIDEENDSAESEEFELKWNGTTFGW